MFYIINQLCAVFRMPSARPSTGTVEQKFHGVQKCLFINSRDKFKFKLTKFSLIKHI